MAIVARASSYRDLHRIDVDHQLMGQVGKYVLTGSPTEPLPLELLELCAPASASVPVTKQEAKEQASKVKAFVMARTASQCQPALPQVKSLPKEKLATIHEHSYGTVVDLHKKHPHLASMDVYKGERLDNEPVTFRTLGPVDPEFIRKMVVAFQISEKEAEVCYHARKWAHIHGFELKPLNLA